MLSRVDTHIWIQSQWNIRIVLRSKGKIRCDISDVLYIAGQATPSQPHFYWHSELLFHFHLSQSPHSVLIMLLCHTLATLATECVMNVFGFEDVTDSKCHSFTHSGSLAA